MFYVWNIALAPLLASPDPGVAATNMMLVPYCKRVFGKFNKTQGCNSQSKRPITEVQLWLRLGTNRQARRGACVSFAHSWGLSRRQCRYFLRAYTRRYPAAGIWPVVQGVPPRPAGKFWPAGAGP